MDIGRAKPDRKKEQKNRRKQDNNRKDQLAKEGQEGRKAYFSVGITVMDEKRSGLEKQ